LECSEIEIKLDKKIDLMKNVYMKKGKNVDENEEKLTK